MSHILSNEDSSQKAKSSERAIERLFNASLGCKTKWAFIGRYYYQIQPDRDLAAIEGLFCEKSVQENTYPVLRTKYKKRWEEMWLRAAWLEAEFWPVDPAMDNALDPTNDNHRTFQQMLQQLLITGQWHLLYQAPLDKGHIWAWIGLYVYKMGNNELARVENLLCNSRVESNRMIDRRRDTQKALEAYLQQQSFKDS